MMVGRVGGCQRCLFGCSLCQRIYQLRESAEEFERRLTLEARADAIAAKDAEARDREIRAAAPAPVFRVTRRPPPPRPIARAFGRCWR